MSTIGAFDAKTHFSALLARVEKGEEIIITKHGHPIAKLIPAKAKMSSGRSLNTIQRLKEFAQSNRLDGLDWKALRDEGRR